MKPPVLLVVICAVGCEPSIALEHRPCPCTQGYTCDIVRRTCVVDAGYPRDAAVVDFLTLQPSETSRPLMDIWGSGPDDIYVAGQNDTLLHSTGDGVWVAINPTASGMNYRGIWGSAANDVYIVAADGSGDNATFLHSTGNGSWVVDAAPTEMLDIWGSSANDIWAVGQFGAIMHSTGGNVWDRVDSPTTSDLQAIWGTSNVNAYAVGSDGAILRWNGTAWSMEPSGTDQYFGSVQGTNASDVYALTYGATLVHSTGDGRWSKAAMAVNGHTLWASPDSGMYLIGCAHSPLYLLANSGRWTPLATSIPPHGCLSAAWGTGPNNLYFTGGVGDIYHHP